MEHLARPSFWFIRLWFVSLATGQSEGQMGQKVEQSQAMQGKSKVLHRDLGCERRRVGLRGRGMHVPNVLKQAGQPGLTTSSRCSPSDPLSACPKWVVPSLPMSNAIQVRG